MAIPRTSPSHLLMLGGLGAAMLWGVAFFNGTLDNMNAAIAKGQMPDGRPLRSTYTGFAPVDGRIEYLVAFYEVLSNHTTLGPRLLFVNMNFLIAATNIWVFVESRRRGVRNMTMRHPVPFMLVWLGLGAAFIQPLYFWLHTRTKAVRRDASVPHNEAIALFFAALPSFLLPMLLFAPSWFLGSDTHEHHGFIGAFLGSPFLIVVCCLTGVGLLIPWHGLVTKKDAEKPNVDQPWIVATLAYTGLLSAIVHVGCVAYSLTSSDPDMSLSRVFLPAPGRMHSFTSAAAGAGLNSTVLVSPLPAAYHTLFEGYHLFTQLDYLIVSAACVVFSHWMLHNRGGDEAKPNAAMTTFEFRDLCLLIIGSFIIGPGAAGSFALAARENKLRQPALDVPVKVKTKQN